MHIAHPKQVISTTKTPPLVHSLATRRPCASPSIVFFFVFVFFFSP